MDDTRTPRRAFIGDVHGCGDELRALLGELRFDPGMPRDGALADEVWFVGDLVNGGPKSDEVLVLADEIVTHGRGGFVVGNHDDYLLRALTDDPSPSERTRESLRQIERGAAIAPARAKSMLKDAPIERHFPDSKVLLVHAAPVAFAAQSDMQRRTALFGPLAEKKDGRGKPYRINWARDYRGNDLVVFGHSPHRSPARFPRAICIDTGCVYGNTLTAYLPHEDRFISVRADKAYREGRVREKTSEGPYL